MKITLKDGSVKEVQKGISVLDLAKEISEGLARNATAGKVNGEVKDLRYNIEEDSEVEILTFDNSEDGKKACDKAVKPRTRQCEGKWGFSKSCANI